MKKIIPNPIFETFFERGTLAFDVNDAMSALSEKSIEVLVWEFSEWCKETVENGKVVNPWSIKSRDLEWKVTNYEWKFDLGEDNNKMRNFRSEISTNYLRSFACHVENTIGLIGYTKTGSMKGLYLKKSFTDSHKIPFDDSKYEIPIPEGVEIIDGRYRISGNPPFHYKVTQLNKFFCAENAFSLAIGNIKSHPDYIGSTDSLVSVLTKDFERELLKFKDFDFMGLDEAKAYISTSKNIHDSLVSIIENDRIHDSFKTRENLSSLIHETVCERLENRCEDIKLNSFSSVTGVSQPKNTCPMIDSQLGDIDTSDYDSEIEAIESRIRYYNDDISSLEGTINDSDLVEEDEDDERSRVKSIESELSSIESAISRLNDELEDKRGERDDYEAEVKNEAENLREACSDARGEIISYREQLYSYFKGMIWEFNDCGERYLVFHPELNSCEGVPHYFIGEGRFNSRLLENQGFGEALTNYDAIRSWGDSLTSLNDTDVYELYNDALRFEDLVSLIVDKAFKSSEELEVEDIAS